MRSGIFSKTRYLIGIAVAGAFLASVILLFYGAYDLIGLIDEALFHHGPEAGSEGLVISLIELMDMFLLATVFYIISMGLFELFIDERLDLPHWLVIHDLDDLKNKLIGVVIVVLGVHFLGQVVGWDGEKNLLGYGAAVALVISALTWFLSLKRHKPADAPQAPVPEGPAPESTCSRTAETAGIKTPLP